MNREDRRIWPWLAVAMSAPLAHFCGSSWVSLLAVGLVCGSLTALTPKRRNESKLISLLEVALILILISQLLPLSAAYWPGPANHIVIPAALLALAAYGSVKNPERVAGILFWVLIVMYIPVAVAGLRDVEPKWIMPKSMRLNGLLIPVLLLPGAVKGLPDRSAGTKEYWSILAFGIALSILANGILSPGIAAEINTPMRELGRTLTIGVAGRFESLVSVIVTLGWFALASLLIHHGSQHCGKLGASKKTAPWIIATAAVLLSWTGVHIPTWFSSVFALFLWVLEPFLHCKKNSKKSEKSA